MHRLVRPGLVTRAGLNRSQRAVHTVPREQGAGRDAGRHQAAADVGGPAAQPGGSGPSDVGPRRGEPAPPSRDRPDEAQRRAGGGH